MLNRIPLTSLLQAEAEVIGVDHCLPTSLSGGGSVAVRRAEVAAALSRMRGLRVT